MHEKLLEIHDLMGKLAVAPERDMAFDLAKAIIKIAVNEEYMDGLTLMSRADSLVVFQTDNPAREIHYGGIGDGKNGLITVGGDNPLTFILGMIWMMGKLKAPIQEVFMMLTAYARSEWAETKGEKK